jgi:hypothetical protein
MARQNRGLRPSLGRYASAVSRIPIEKNANQIMRETLAAVLFQSAIP